MTDIKDCFTQSVGGARDLFLAACSAAHIPVSAFPGTATGTEDDRRMVYADIARFGSPSASRILLLAPAEGGKSAFLAAALMTLTVGEKLYRHLPRDVGLLLLHAINPKGPLWPHRNQQATPRPDDWEDGMLAQAEARFQARPETEQAFNRKSLAQRPLSDMIQPAWNHEVIGSIAGQYLGECRQIHILELAQSGGSAGDLELVRDAGENWLPRNSELRTSEAGNQTLLADHLRMAVGGAQTVTATASFGTEPHKAAPPDKNREKFIPHREPLWQKTVWDSAADLISQTMKKLGDAAAGKD